MHTVIVVTNSEKTFIKPFRISAQKANVARLANVAKNANVRKKKNAKKRNKVKRQRGVFSLLLFYFID